MNANETDPTAPQPPASESPQPTNTQRLWTPWRMRYVGGGAAEPGCLFCNRLAADDDVRSLIFYRDDRVFVIMNLFPYNTGHVMIVPNDHAATPESAAETTLARMGTLLRPTLRALRRALNADGFNAGLNVGSVAGAGVADHLHLHLVPRWQGDANFMPILGSTMVLPELIPVTYAKLRAELDRELAGHAETSYDVSIVVLSQNASSVLLDGTGQRASLPSTSAGPGQAIWRAIAQHLTELGVEAILAGWAGPTRASSAGRPALTYLASTFSPATETIRFEPVERAFSLLASEDDRAVLRNAVAHLAPLGA
ncbi:MAG TPA: HIT domain-containing protein [Thermomicrobiales bacterium]|jgi:ATP adenylyltransferase